MSFQQVLQEDRRLVILRTLQDGGGYSQNEFVIRTMLGQLGHNISNDLVRTELSWLEEQGLLTMVDVMGTRVATITTRGKDTALGYTTVPGVKKPEPM